MQLPMIFKADSYKLSHYRQYPESAKFVSSFIESRGGEYDKTVMFGLQGFIMENLCVPISMADVKKMQRFAKAHGVSFNAEGWERLVMKHDGYYPLRIEAVPEGTVINGKNVLVQIVNTDPEFPWITSYAETAILRGVWYPTTVCTNSYRARKLLEAALAATSDKPEGIDFMMHDFGARGVSSSESAQIGGAAHLVNFMGTDTMEGIIWAQEYYASPDEMLGYSVDATEHSTVTSWGKAHEVEMYSAYLETAEPGKILSCVSDSYNIYNACENLWGGILKEKVKALGPIGARLVVRPDSGDPVVVPIECVKILMKKFGNTVNSKGYRVLPDYLRVLQGDGITINSLPALIEAAEENHLSIENFVFGQGGGLLQMVNRDTFKFAMKASAIKLGDEWFDVFKDPITDPGKQSKKGRLALVQHMDGSYHTIRHEELYNMKNLLEVVYENGYVKKIQKFSEIRDRAKI